MFVCFKHYYLIIKSERKSGRERESEREYYLHYVHVCLDISMNLVRVQVSSTKCFYFFCSIFYFYLFSIFALFISIYFLFFALFRFNAYLLIKVLSKKNIEMGKECVLTLMWTFQKRENIGEVKKILFFLY